MNLPPLQARSDPFDDIHIVEPLCAVFRRRLKAEGLKYTPERAQILDAIIRRDDVFRADELMDSMRQSIGNGTLPQEHGVRNWN